MTATSTVATTTAARPGANGDSTPHGRRVRFVTGVIQEHSELDAESAEALARRVLHALDHVPEKIR